MNIFNRFAQRYLLSPRPRHSLFKYLKDGEFDYQRYVKIQSDGNKRKLHNVWADEKTIDIICEYLQSTHMPLRRGLCHGSRNGTEVRWFRERLGIDIIGTDISETAAEFGLAKWDFHDTKPDWIGQFDFVYTNSHDHAYDPQKAFNSWIEQLSEGGKLIIEHTSEHSGRSATELDPFGVDAEIFPYTILTYSDEFAVTRMIRPSHQKSVRGEHSIPIWLFIIERVGGRPR